MVFVFLVLSAQYESWSLPMAIILIVPMCILAALVGVVIAKLDNNVFVQIGLVVLVGLAAKNAILIVEFAKQLQDEGKPLRNATIDACRLRLRPILMTTAALVAGMIPLALGTGAGAGSRRTVAIVVIGGQTLCLLLTLVVTPVAYSLFDDLAHLRILQRLQNLVRLKALPVRSAITRAQAGD